MQDRIRCGWSSGEPLYIEYHDNEWGVPLHEDRKLFEMLILEGFQAGLSWLIILRKRKNFRKAFDDFDVKKIANYDKKKINSLLKDEGIIRNKLKIQAAIINAKCFLEVQKEFGSFNNYIWQFVDYIPIQNNFKMLAEIPAKTNVSDTISKDLKKKGFKFVGSTICYAFMQAVGITNDHIVSCWKYRIMS